MIVKHTISHIDHIFLLIQGSNSDIPGIDRIAVNDRTLDDDTLQTSRGICESM